MTVDGASRTDITLANVSHSSAISVDASAATGAFTFDGSLVANTGTGNRSFTIEGGSAADVLIGGQAAVINTFTGGAGNDRFVMTINSTNDVITDFVAGDLIATGETAAVAGTFVNGLNAAIITAGEQATIEGQTSVAAAASAAAAAAGVAAANEALAFTFQGNQYIYMSEDGVDTFNVATDSVVQVSGLTGTSEFASGTFLFTA